MCPLAGLTILEAIRFTLTFLLYAPRVVRYVTALACEDGDPTERSELSHVRLLRAPP